MLSNIQPPDFWSRAYRTAWAVVWILFYRTSPPMAHTWRCFLLRCFGAQIGSRVHVYPNSRIWAPKQLELASESCIASGVEVYNVCKVILGKRAVISQKSYLCAGSHDIDDPAFKLIGGPIVIESDAWIAADAFVGPGVTVGQGAVVAARATVMRDVSPWTVVAGNPARVIRTRRRFVEGAEK